jgi:hypothetical protein
MMLCGHGAGRLAPLHSWGAIMTTINPALSTAVNAAVLTQFGADLGRSMNFSKMQFTLGTLVAGLFAQAPAQPKFSASMPQAGKADIDLGDGNTLQIDEASSQIVVKDSSGNTTRIWGDPHFEHNGKAVGDFWGTTSLVLENGTKITINTQKDPNNSSVSYANQVVVTRGDQALVVDGVSQLQQGDLKVSLGGNGYALDRATNDGLVLRENDSLSSGWSSGLTGGAVGQADFNLTKPGMEGLRDGLQAFNSALGLMFGAWLGGNLVSFAALSAEAHAAEKPGAHHHLPLLFDRA